MIRGIRYGCCADYAEELLLRYLDSKSVRFLSEKIKAMDENRISSYINDFIRTYRTDLALLHYFVKASLLGKSQITVNGVVIPETEWKTKKVKSLLDYHPGRTTG